MGSLFFLRHFAIRLLKIKLKIEFNHLVTQWLQYVTKYDDTGKKLDEKSRI